MNITIVKAVQFFSPESAEVYTFLKCKAGGLEDSYNAIQEDAYGEIITHTAIGESTIEALLTDAGPLDVKTIITLLNEVE